MNEVLCTVYENGLASITLNRPRAINALSYEMIVAIDRKLREWKNDERISVIVMSGAGEKGFCAGGDIKTLYEARSSSLALQHGEKYFEVEYELDILIHRFLKPIIACLDGIVMGGGVGLTNGASHRIVTERTKWAMPEMNIGFFPDVGASYFLNKAPGYVGRYLALTAAVIDGVDALYINSADIFMSQAKVQGFLTRLQEVDWHGNDSCATLNEVIKEYEDKPSKKSDLASLQKEIDVYFSFQTVEAIIDSLNKGNSDFAEKTKNILLEKSPVSLKVALKQVIAGERKTLVECFATELVLAKSFLQHEDFFEGIRSVLIDKDQRPKYVYKKLADVSDGMVNSFFRAT